MNCSRYDMRENGIEWDEIGDGMRCDGTRWDGMKMWMAMWSTYIDSEEGGGGRMDWRTERHTDRLDEFVIYIGVTGSTHGYFETDTRANEPLVINTIWLELLIQQSVEWAWRNGGYRRFVSRYSDKIKPNTEPDCLLTQQTPEYFSVSIQHVITSCCLCRWKFENFY